MAKRPRNLAEHAEHEGRKQQVREQINMQLERMEGRGLLPDTTLWTPERHLPFFRISETTHSMPWLAPAGAPGEG